MPDPWFDELSELLAIPSVSADPERKDDVTRAAEWLAGFIRDAGGSAEVVPTDTQPLILSVDKRGNLYLNLGKDEEKPVGEEVVLERVGAVLRREPKTPVLVKADQNVPYGRVVAGMVLLQQAGAEKVGFITDPVETKRRPQR